MTEFLRVIPTVENKWRALILLGRNVASYKFALGKALFELKDSPNDLIPMEELALPFALNLCAHLRETPQQGQRNINKPLLDACMRFNQGEANENLLRDVTTKHGFANVIDAFHVLSGGPIADRFFIDERKTSGGVRLTDAFRKLIETPFPADLASEIEGRWRVVETGWALGVNTGLIEYDVHTGALSIRDQTRRIALRSCVDTLIGYQKGRCFYCFAQISRSNTDHAVDVDHFHPWKYAATVKNVDGIWNLVLACSRCNRGSNGKFDKAPDVEFLERLHKRNEFYIDSKHRLAETLKKQTGDTEQERRDFLKQTYRDVVTQSIHTWKPAYAEAPAF